MLYVTRGVHVACFLLWLFPHLRFFFVANLFVGNATENGFRCAVQRVLPQPIRFCELNAFAESRASVSRELVSQEGDRLRSIAVSLPTTA